MGNLNPEILWGQQLSAVSSRTASEVQDGSFLPLGSRVSILKRNNLDFGLMISSQGSCKEGRVRRDVAKGAS